MATALTPTSYAVLGLLALKPWSTYELAQQMDRALGQFWPRAESRLYEEPKKLVAHGLARASSEMVGQRPRTIYTITAKGRRALANWVPAPGEGPVLEFEQLVKVFFAEHATKADLLATLVDVREWSEQRIRASAGVPQAYLARQGPFPERLPWLILVGQFLIDFYLMVGRWAEWAGDVVETWPEDLAAAEPDWNTLETHRRITSARARES
jgi:DNA-binding PadR family transcriptional regulator